MSTTTEVAPKRETEVPVHHDSQEEYESAEEIEGEYDEDDIEEIEIEEEVEEEEEVEDEEDEEGEDDEDQKPKEKPLDDDEDRKNPQFIPKKGYFYEHDDRTKIEEENAEEVEEPQKKEEKPKKPADSLDRWTHDKFDESEQAPKSHDELTNLYGYDIRSEDQPPRARRRRRYGRGPTKYTRRWEEEEAYQKPRGGFRGRGRGTSGRGAGRDRRRDSKDEYEEEFPELGDAATKSAPPEDKEECNAPKPLFKSNISGPPPPRRDIKEPQPPQIKRDSGRDNFESNRDNNTAPPRRMPGRGGNRQQESDRDVDNYSSRGARGGRGGGGGGGNNGNRRGGRRNEFTNRNRYPNRRDQDQDYNDYPNHAPSHNGPKNVSDGRNSNARASHSNSYENSRERDFGGGPRNNRHEGGKRVEQKEYRMIVNGTSNESKPKPPSNDVRQDKPMHQQQSQPQQHRVPPFTNTEYPAPTKANVNSSVRHGPPNSGMNSNRSHNERPHAYNEAGEERYREPKEPSVEPQKEVRDLREKLNAMRMQKGYQNQNDRIDRRNQMPPRLQQQQQQQQPPPQQIDPSAKPRRYSTQRERPVQQPTIVTTGGMVIPNTVPPAMAQGVPNMVPVVTMAEGVVPSTVAPYQPANYFEGTQVYEASGSPVTGTGPSVSPSLWNPHAPAYATAPYPSPPTAPQVPQPPYADPTAFIGPGGPAIYAAPPQFLQDPTIMNYSGAAPPFPPPYHAHPQGFQGYAQVTPAPPPEVYHGGVTYYSTQNQIQRPPMMAPQKRPKSVLQLVEPPEKSKGPKEPQTMEQPPAELGGMNSIPENPAEVELSRKLQETTLDSRENSDSSRNIREYPPETSWADEMELTSPTDVYPEGNHFGIQGDTDSKRESVEREQQGSHKETIKEEASNNAEKSEKAAE